MIKKNIKHKIWPLIINGIFISSCLIILIIPNIIFHTTLGVSTWNQTSDTDFDNGILNNLTIVGSKDTAQLKINLSGIQTWTKKSPTSKPVARDKHAMASVYGTDKIVLFGGYTLPGGYKNLDDTWVYDLSDNTWTLQSPVIRPSARQSHAMASVYGDDKVVLFGGSPSTFSDLDDIWVYDLSNDTWTEKAKGPLARFSHTMATIDGDDKVIMYGGGHWNGMSWDLYDDTWVYDLSSNSWTQKSNGPIGRYWHAMGSIDGDDKFVVHGGANFSWTNETWVYDLSDDKWTRKIPKNHPGTRIDHAMARICGTDNVLLFGGRYISYNNETWLYDLNDDTWTRKITKNQPSIRNNLKMAFIYGDDKIVLFGGSYFDGSTWYYYDDTWVYRHFLPTRNGTFVSSSYDCGYNSSFKEIQWYAVTPENTSVKLQLRTAENESNLYKQDFVGPEGNKTSFYTGSLSSIWSGHEGDRWIQFKAYLNMSVFTDSPSIKDITIIYNCLPETFVVSPIDGSVLTNNRPTFTWTFKDPDSEHQEAFQLVIDDNMNFEDLTYDSGEQHVAEQSWEFPAGTNYTKLSDGTWYWKVRTKDADDLWTDYSLPRLLMIDTHSPTSAIIIPANNEYYNSLKSISGLATDGVNGTGISNVEISIKNNYNNQYWSGSNWGYFNKWLGVVGTARWTYDSSNINWTSGNSYYIQSRVTDNASNMEVTISGNNFAIDMDSPISTIITPENDIYLNNLESLTGISMDFSNSGIIETEISIKCIFDNNIWDGIHEENHFWNGTEWRSNRHWLPVEGTDQWSFDTSNIPWSTGNQYLIQTRATDRTNNVENPSSGNAFIYDAVPPEVISIVINNNQKYTSSTEISLSLQAEDFGTGISSMSLSTDGSIWSDWEVYNLTRSFNLDDGDGEKIIYFRVRDYAGNIAKPKYGTIVLDTTPPDDLSIIINENVKYTNSIIVKLNLHAIDSGSGLSHMTFSYDNFYWQIWEPFQHSKAISIPVGDGEKKVYFRIRDKANNTANPVYDSIILDSKPPHSLYISINNGAKETNSTVVNLKLRALDDISGINQLSFSTDNESWSAWENYLEFKTYNLPQSDGLKIIYFRANDKAGNIADPVSTAILLNTSSPISEKSVPVSSNNLQILYIFLIIIIIVLVIMTIAMVGVIKRRKRYIQELLPPGAITIKSGGLLLPQIPLDLISSTPKSTELPSSIRTLESQESITPAPQIPALAKSTQITQETDSGQVAQVPQLPPAKVQQSPQNTLPPDVKTTQLFPTIAPKQPTLTKPQAAEPEV